MNRAEPSQAQTKKESLELVLGSSRALEFKLELGFIAYLKNSSSTYWAKNLTHASLTKIFWTKNYPYLYIYMCVCVYDLSDRGMSLDDNQANEDHKISSLNFVNAIKQFINF